MSSAAPLCWRDYQALVPRGSRVIFYDANCYLDVEPTSIFGNYSVRSLNDDRYSVREGDQLCGSDYADNSYYHHYQQDYSGNFLNSRSFRVYPQYDHFYGKVELVCDNRLGGGDCQMQISVCMDVERQKYELDLQVVEVK